MTPTPRGGSLLLCCLVLCAAVPRFAAADDAPTGRQYALLVGVRNYNKDQLRSLRFTESDVSDLAQILRDAGYKRVVLMTQTEAAAKGDNELLPESDRIRRQLKAILDDRKPGDTVLVAFSGHGVQFRNDAASYFCPMDTRLDDAKTLVSLAEVYQALQACEAGTKVLLVDACRNDPEAALAKAVERIKLESVTRPQAERPPGGVAALFSCSEGQKSYESEKLGHGVFFHYIIEGLRGGAANKKGEVTLQGLTAYVTDEVPDAVKEVSTDARQRPQQVGDLSGPTPLVTVGERDEIGNTVGMKFKRIRSGRFLMGSPKDEDGHGDDEPQHEVEITKPFYVGVCPVTVGQFRTFVQDARHTTAAELDGQGWGYDASTRKLTTGKKYTWKDPGFAQTDAHPVVNVTWSDAVAFCAWLSKKEGKTYTLPTEAEWEYACRAGTTTRFWCGDADGSLEGHANIADTALRDRLDADFASSFTFASRDDHFPFTSPVGSFKANPWGLYDMHGNVWQWCADGYGADSYRTGGKIDPKGPNDGDSRVLRGGSWGSDPKVCRSANRNAGAVGDRHVSIGFRVVLHPAMP